MLLLLALACTPTAPSSLLRTEAEPPGDNCAAGGSAVSSGLDDDGDGVLGDDEVDHTVYVCNGESGASGNDGADGQDGQDGGDSLIAVTDEPAGTNCAYGGERIDSGLDDDGDGTLDPEEIDATAYVCDGAPGGTSLVNVETETEGANCPYGGRRVESGVDTNGDGALSPDEVTATAYVCNGDVGDTGAGALVTSAEEPAGTNCADGGVAVSVGTDDDGDGALSDTEVDTTFYVCDGADGSGGGIAGTIVAGDYAVNNSLDADLLAGVVQITGTLTIDGAGMGAISLPDLVRVGLLSVGHSGDAFSPSSLQLPALTTVDDALAIGNLAVADWSGFDSVTTVGGFVTLYGSGASTISAFRGLSSVGGAVYVYLPAGTGVEELSGFDSLTTVPSTLSINFTSTGSATTHVSGFANLSEVGALYLDADPQLTDITGLSALKDVSGELRVGITGLTDLTQLASLSSVGSLTILDADSLTSLAGLESVAALPAGLSVTYSDGLTDLTGLDGVTNSGPVTIQNNDALVDFIGLDNLTTIDGRLTVQDLTVASLAGLDALTTVDELVVSGNDSLTDLSALSSVTGTVAPLTITENPSLPNLDGLEGIGRLGYPSSADATSYALVLESNDMLSDITGLYGLTAVDYGLAYVGYNGALCTTAVTALRGHLGTNNGTWTVSGNKGC